jgi:hypothetical protein
MPKINVNPRCQIVKRVRAFCAIHLSAIHDHLGVIRWRRQVLRSLKRRRKC